MKKLRLILLALSILPCLLWVPAVDAQTAPLQDACSEVTTTEKPGICQTGNDNPVSGEDGIIIKAANIVATITGIAAVLIIIVAGLQYVTAAGEANKVSSAKQAIIFAIVGLVVVLLARTIVAFIIRRL